jgi:sulfide:quinone oxidoreductase
VEANRSARPRFKVVIAGGSVAAVEGALALHALARDRVTVTLLAPNEDFVYRPMTVREPFDYALAHRFPLAEIAGELGVSLCVDSLEGVDAEGRKVQTSSGRSLGYDGLLLALGARRREQFRYATTLDDTRIDDQLHGLIQDVESGYISRLAFLIPSRMAWPMPIYELALMTAGRAYDMNVDVSITIVTPEDSPLAIFGAAASAEVERRLEERGIATVTSAHCEVHEPGRVLTHPGSQELAVDRIVALPELSGPSVPGVTGASEGFIPVDVYGRVRHLESVYAAGDATDFPIKFGGIAAQQADVAATSIAALAGAQVDREPFSPVIRGILLGPDKPLYLSAHVSGGHGSTSEASETPLWFPPSKIAANYLSRYLERRDRAAQEPDR